MIDAPSRRFQSLKTRILGPLAVTAGIAAMLIAFASYAIGSRSADRELRQRRVALERSLAQSNFPLGPTVLPRVSELTQTELITLDREGRRLHMTLESDVKIPTRSGETISAPAGRDYVAFRFATESPQTRQDRVHTVVLLFDREQIDTSRRNAALLPLVTGLSTVVAISLVTLVVTSRLVRRIGGLRESVRAISEGDFLTPVPESGEDELGSLGVSVASMGQQLETLWGQVHRQQGEKLLHQMAGGLAHQMRNTLTGARMAVELHRNECPLGEEEGLAVAIHQIEQAEQDVHRLLLVAAGREGKDRPMSVEECWHDIQRSLSPIANHLGVEHHWTLEDEARDRVLRDGPTWTAAATNLIHNAMQAGSTVTTVVTLDEPGELLLVITDDGDGIPDAIADDVFEPFVTGRPEGLGLGLPVVRRAAEYLGGCTEWRRVDGRTEFRMVVSTEEK
ncbi:MAG: HAMP domain-containing sensor histidine kinase [Planctomycetota bacterium]